jgi:hypothetical protein
MLGGQPGFLTFSLHAYSAIPQVPSSPALIADLRHGLVKLHVAAMNHHA